MCAIAVIVGDVHLGGERHLVAANWAVGEPVSKRQGGIGPGSIVEHPVNLRRLLGVSDRKLWPAGLLRLRRPSVPHSHASRVMTSRSGRTGVKPGHRLFLYIAFSINNLRDGSTIAPGVDMKTLGLLLALLALPFLIVTANAQDTDAPEGALIKSAQVSGLAFDQLSPGLRQSIDALVGDRLNRERVAALAARIEAEHPDRVAAIRSVAAPDGEARVVFLVARISDDKDLEANINARYTIESVEIAGVPDANVSQALRDDLQRLVGGRIDDKQIEPLLDRLHAELPGYDITRRTSRGSERGQIRLVFDVRKGESMRLVHFAPPNSKALYHSDQGWSGVLDIPIEHRDHRVTLLFPFGNDDDLIEEYSGYGLRVESRKVGTERLGLSLELSRFHQSWEASTLSALESDPTIPEAYRVRTTISPSATFAISPSLLVNAGASITELESLSHSPDSQMASAAVASISYKRQWTEAAESTQRVYASFAVRSATDALQSDLIYKRYFGSGAYQYLRGNSHVTAEASAGRLTGHAPLFERFSLGDSTTLRGWNKFDIAPAGGDRMFHASLEYGPRAPHDSFVFFVDAGSVWDRGTDSRVRVSTGIGYYSHGMFATLGLPLNANHLGAAFMFGIRGSSVGRRF